MMVVVHSVLFEAVGLVTLSFSNPDRIDNLLKNNLVKIHS
jgi:hypothetical protein